MNNKNYPRNWADISFWIRRLSGDRCTLCHAQKGETHWWSRKKTVIKVHHSDGDKTNNSKFNLIPVCNHCHSILDLGLRMASFKHPGSDKDYWVKEAERLNKRYEEFGDNDPETMKVRPGLTREQLQMSCE